MYSVRVELRREHPVVATSTRAADRAPASVRRSPTCSATTCRSASTATTGASVGPRDAATRLVVRSPDALRYILTAPGELGFARAYVAGELDVEGDIFDALELRERLPDVRLRPRAVARARATRRRLAVLQRPPVPAEEARLHGRRHTRARDAAAISHHYDVSNDFYRHRPRTLDDVLVRGVVVAGRHARGGAGREVRPRSAASSGCGRACGCSTSAAVGAAW